MVKLKDAVVPVGLLEEVAVVKGLVKDGLGDVFAVDGDQLQPLLGPLFARDGGLSLPAPPRAVSAGDLDGVPDVFFTASDDVVVRRNRGSWAFSEFRQGIGMGTRLSVSVGDVDADGDPDVAVTFSTSADATRTAVVRNRAR